MFSPRSVGDAERFERRKASASAAGTADEGLQTDRDEADAEVPCSAAAAPGPAAAVPGCGSPLGGPRRRRPCASGLQHLGELPGRRGGGAPPPRGQRQHRGQRPPRPAVAARCALPGSAAALGNSAALGALPRGSRCFGPLLLRPHPQPALDSGVWLPAVFFLKEEVDGRTSRSMYLLLLLTGFLLMVKQLLSFLGKD